MQTATWDALTYDAERKRLVPCFNDFYGTVGELVARLAAGHPRVLDLGAGTGILAEAIVNRTSVGSLTLLDSSAEMLAVARQRLSALKFDGEIVCRSFLDPLPEGPFDAVVSALAIHHLEDSEKRDLYRRIFEILAPGGLFVNAEQVESPHESNKSVFEATHLEYAAKSGSSPREIAAAVERMRIDKCATTDAQLRWLSNVGFVEEMSYFQWFRFSVFAARKRTQ